MSRVVGFDRPIELSWLDLLASHYAETRDVKAAFYDTRAVVELTVGGGASPHNATGKTMTVLARVWLKVPKWAERLRDDAAQSMVNLSPADRLAVHWAMSELAYPFFLDAASAIGRLARLQDEFTLAQFKQRLTEEWGARGTMPPAAQRLLKTWTSWGVLVATDDRGTYAAAPRVAVSAEASVLVARSRVLAESGRPLVIDDFAHLADLFPFTVDLAFQQLRGAPEVDTSATAAGRVVVARIAT